MFPEELPRQTNESTLDIKNIIANIIYTKISYNLMFRQPCHQSAQWCIEQRAICLWVKSDISSNEYNYAKINFKTYLIDVLTTWRPFSVYLMSIASKSLAGKITGQSDENHPDTKFHSEPKVSCGFIRIHHDRLIADKK